MEKEQLVSAEHEVKEAVSSYQFRFSENFNKLVDMTENIELVSLSKWQQDRLAKAN